MKDNIILASDGSEVYTNRITELADQYINYELDEERKQEIYNNSSMFMAMILYIADNIDKPDNNDMPSREQNTGGDTGQAVYLRNGWDFAEQRAKIDEPVTKRSEREFLKVVLNILKTKQQISPKLTIADIDIKITRNKTDNMLVKAQALIYLLEKGIHPKIAIKTCDLWGDPEKVYVVSKDYLDAKYKTASKMQAEADAEHTRQLELFKSSVKGGEEID